MVFIFKNKMIIVKTDDKMMAKGKKDSILK